MTEKINIGSDVSIVSKMKYATGVQRVLVETHKRLNEIFANSNINFRGLNLSGGRDFRANSYLTTDPILSPPYLEFSDLQIVLSFDGNNGYIFRELSNLTTKPRIVSLAYDILPIIEPDYFQNLHLFFKIYILRMLKISDYIICNSEETKANILALNWLTNAKFLVAPLGAFEIKDCNFEKSNSKLSLIAINTIEPRKGHDDILSAFNYLNLNGVDVELNIVGKYGWNSQDIVEKIQDHPLLGTSLFWHKGISDEEISNLYKASNISIVASRAEGFGLTLEEGLANGCKVIARDIPVFRERQNSNLYFFEGAGEELASKILDVADIPWNPDGISQIRTMKDFAEDVADLIHEIAEGLPEAT
jgi:glycosyltransferase involved in cell wall biosynthesis